MRYAIISDIHSNVHALRSALECIEKENVETIICLGDIVGYNANPTECIEIIRNTPKIKYILQGNHDEALTRFDQISYSQWRDWSNDASVGLEYSNSIVSKSNIGWLKLHSESVIIEDPNITFFASHHSPCGKTINWGYVLEMYDAKDALMSLKNKKIKLAFFGHSHLPTIANSCKKDNKIKFTMGACVCESPIKINKDLYYIINPGAIGQPRGKVPTTYAIFDSDKLTISVKAFEYDIKSAQKAILGAKYASPQAGMKLAKRLEE